MEKKRSVFFNLAKPTCTANFLSIIFSTHAQKLETFKNYCGGFCKSMADLMKILQGEIGFYNFRSGQMIASIGPNTAAGKLLMQLQTNSVSFYPEDIDSSKFKKSQVEFAWNYCATVRGRPMTSDYKIIIGDERSTSLPVQKIHLARS